MRVRDQMARALRNVLEIPAQRFPAGAPIVLPETERPADGPDREAVHIRRPGERVSWIPHVPVMIGKEADEGRRTRERITREPPLPLRMLRPAVGTLHRNPEHHSPTGRL